MDEIFVNTNIGAGVAALGFWLLGIATEKVKQWFLRSDDYEEIRAEAAARGARVDAIIAKWRAEQQAAPHGAAAIAAVAESLSAPAPTEDCDGPPECEACMEELRDPHYECRGDAEEQRRSFAFGNAALANPDVTRDLVDEIADDLSRPASFYLNPRPSDSDERSRDALEEAGLRLNELVKRQREGE